MADSDETNGIEISKRFRIRGTPATIVLGGDGTEVDWFIGYAPPADNFQARLEKILKGEGTYKSLQAALAANPKNVEAVFGLARKWRERHDSAKAMEKYLEVIALDPGGEAGAYTDEDTFVRAPYAEYAKFYIASANSAGPKFDPAPLKAFIAENSQSKLVKQAYKRLADYYDRQAPKEEADKFFDDLGTLFPDDVDVLSLRLGRIVRHRAPIDDAVELAERLREMTASNPDIAINQIIAQAYELAGARAEAAGAYGRRFIESRIDDLAYKLANYANYWIGRNENLDSAAAMAEKALSLRPGEFYFLMLAAKAVSMTGNETRALEIFGPAWLAKSASDIMSYYDIQSYASFWLQRGKNLESALFAIRKAIDYDPNYYSVWTTLSGVQAKLGNKAEAIKAAEKAVELAPASAKAEVQKKLDALRKQAPERE